MKYKNKYTGVIVEPSCDVAAQGFRDSLEWAEYAGGESDGEKALSKMNKTELLAVATEKGIIVPDGANKRDIIALIEGGEPGGETD